MDLIISLILGAVQGLTEFLPVSSSGHLTLLQHFFTGVSDRSYIEYVNIGTFLALVVYFRWRIVDIAIDVFKNKKYKLARNIALTSIPAGLVGYILAESISTIAIFSNVWLIASVLGFVGIIMIVIDRLPRAAAVESGEQLSAARAFLIGIAQMCALFPGVSRSGATIIAGRLSGLSHEKAAEYSFLASIPIMAAVTCKLLLSASDRQYMLDNLSIVLIGNVAAFVVGFAAVGFLLKFLSRHSLQVFGWYRVILAAVVLVALLLQSM